MMRDMKLRDTMSLIYVIYFFNIKYFIINVFNYIWSLSMANFDLEAEPESALCRFKICTVQGKKTNF